MSRGQRETKGQGRLNLKEVYFFGMFKNKRIEVSPVTFCKLCKLKG